MTVPVPPEWTNMVAAFQCAAERLASAPESVMREKRVLERNIVQMRQEIESFKPSIPKSQGMPKDARERIAQLFTDIKGRQLGLLKRLEEEVTALAEVEGDRFVVAVFGEVNSGKSSLSNHVAGFDFGRAVGAGEAFCGRPDRIVERLEEAPIECTAEFQGFTLPGLRWIDCPGILSTTAQNQATALRLISRADFLVYISSSDAPLKESEVVALSGLLKTAGREMLDAALVLTKADRGEEDVDEVTGEIVRRVSPKPASDLKKQKSWLLEQLDRHGALEILRIHPPIAVSVLCARVALESTQMQSTLTENGDPAYLNSGIPELFRLLTEIATGAGADVKARWVERRRAEMRQTVSDTTAAILSEISITRKSIRELRLSLRIAAKDAAEVAAATARAEAGSLLAQHNLRTPAKYDRTAAHRALSEMVRNTAANQIETRLKESYDVASSSLSVELRRLEAETPIDLGVTHIVREVRSQSNHIPKAVGVSAGLLIGLLTNRLAMVVAPILGGVFGSHFGSESIEKVAVGYNVDEVERRARDWAAHEAEALVAGFFSDYDRKVLGPIEESLRGITRRVKKWGRFRRPPHHRHVSTMLTEAALGVDDLTVPDGEDLVSDVRPQRNARTNDTAARAGTKTGSTGERHTRSTRLQATDQHTSQAATAGGIGAADNPILLWILSKALDYFSKREK